MTRSIARLFITTITAAFALTACERQQAHRLEPVAKGDLPWLTDVDQGLAKAKAEKKPALVAVGGSDWCIWCQRLAQEVFSQPKFADYARDRFVLVDLDLPQFESLPPGVLEQRQAAAERLKVNSYPTVVVYGVDGAELGRLGYVPGGPDAFIGQLEKLVGK